jgi:predicted phage terminase large subunit-like protein
MYPFFVLQKFDPTVMEEFHKTSGGRDFIWYCKTTTDANKDNLDPSFYASMKAMYPAGWMREQEIMGEFANEGGQIGDSRWFSGKIMKTVPADWTIDKKVRFWDFAATEKKLKNDPDFSVGSLLSKTREKEYKIIIEEQVSGRWLWEKLKPKIVEVARKDGPYVPIVIEEEPGSGGKNQVAEIKLHFKELGMVEWKVIGQKPTDRLIEANTWFALASNGRVYMIEGLWNADLLEEVDGFTIMLHDDKVTSISGGVRWLSPFKLWNTQSFITLDSTGKQ